MVRLRLAILLVLLLALAAAPGARASADQEATLQEDDHLVYATPQEVVRTIRELQVLGVDRIRVTVGWSLVAPDSGSTTRPKFDATDPNAYPADHWDRFDRIVTAAYSAGIKVNFNVSLPGPLWARSRKPPYEEKNSSSYAPRPSDWADFLVALGRRYSGSFPSPYAEKPSSSPTLPVPLPVPGTTTTPPPPSSSPSNLPRVDYWSLGNEPNRTTWLAPQYRRVSGRWIPEAAVTYRRLVEAGMQALYATGHGGDTILAGENAARGSGGHGRFSYLAPLYLTRSMFCVDGSYHQLRGTSARLFGCPASGRAADFAKAYPLLFRLTGYSHHPYSFTLAPGVHDPDRAAVPLVDLGRLTSTLDRVFRHYGSARRLPIYLTEYGYQSNPPDPYQPWTLAEQAAFLDQADWITFHNPRVRTLTQFELLDVAPVPDKPRGTPARWATFQSGLSYADGRHKPSYDAYRLPLWLPQTRVSPREPVTVWGLVRPAANGQPTSVRIEYRAKGAKSFGVVRTLSYTSPRNQFTTRVRLARSGTIRFAWTRPQDGAVFRSRAAAFAVR